MILFFWHNQDRLGNIYQCNPVEYGNRNYSMKNYVILFTWTTVFRTSCRQLLLVLSHELLNSKWTPVLISVWTFVLIVLRTTVSSMSSWTIILINLWTMIFRTSSYQLILSHEPLNSMLTTVQCFYELLYCIFSDFVKCRIPYFCELILFVPFIMFLRAGIFVTELTIFC
jgi:hypothetical protein